MRVSNARTWLLAGACVALAVGATVAVAQYALDLNTRVNMGVGANRHDAGHLGRRNTYRPSTYAYRSPSPYTINRNTGTYTYNANAAFGRSYYRPTGYNHAGGSYAYHRRIRAR